MKPLQTPIDVGQYPAKCLTYGDGIIAIGSCFSEHIGSHLREMGHHIEENPFGVLYNPLIIARVLKRLLDQKVYTFDDLIEYDGLFHSFDHHGSFSSADPEYTLRLINDSLKRSIELLERTKVLFLTWGTAYIYSLNNSAEVVANCHKLPASYFSRRLYNVEELFSALRPVFAEILERYPQLQIVSTLSPIRHLRDGAVANQVSKATLLLMNQNLLAEFQGRMSYFPAYEILLDELRDYRFYANDLLHPSSLAVEIIQERLCNYLFSSECLELASSVRRMKLEWEHKPLHPDHPDYELKREQLILRILSFQKQFPEVLMPWYKNEKQIF